MPSDDDEYEAANRMDDFLEAVNYGRERDVLWDALERISAIYPPTSIAGRIAREALAR